MPEPGTIFADLKRETSDNLGVSVLFGSAQNGWGVRRLLKALRHEAPGPEATAARLGVDAPAVHAFKIYHGGSVGRLALARAIGGPIHENSDFKSSSDEHGRVGALFSVQGDKTSKISEASNGDLVAVAKVDGVKSGDWLGAGKLPPPIETSLPSRNCSLAIQPADRKDDVKLSGALARILEEDPSLTLEQDEASHEMRLRGINDEHLRTSLAKLKRRYGVEVNHHAPSIGYRESIRKPVTQRAAKKQSGGHGQYGDVIIEIGHWPAAKASISRRRFTEGQSPSNGSRRSNKASRMRCRRGRSASPSSMSR